MKLKLLFVVVVLSCTAHAQSDRFNAAMQKNIAQIDSSFSSADKLVALSNNFERIAVAEKNQWLPYYYAAYLTAMSGYIKNTPEENDVIGDKASALLMKADSLMPNNSEISTVKSIIATLCMLVNPMARYMEYGMQADTWLTKAKEQDPANPRPHMLKGQTLKHTPKQFGGGCEVAMKELVSAKEKYAVFKPAGQFYPDWGARQTEQLIAECQ